MPGRVIPSVDLDERLVSAGCAIQNMLLMATALGFGSALTSGKALKSAPLRTLFGLRDGESALCFISVGTVESTRPARPRPTVADYLSTGGLVKPSFMNISCFDDLLIAAAAQSEPQRLLLVLAQASSCPTTPPPEVIEASSVAKVVPWCPS